MKFNCDKRLDREKARARWHRVFAFLPHRVGEHDCRWLEVIERRCVVWYYRGHGGTRKEYRACP